MKPVADIAVYSPDDRLKLVVEVKGYKDATDEWAAQMRRNLLDYNAVPAAEYFLLVLPEHSYLWRENDSLDAVPADYKVPTKDTLRLRGHYANPEKLSSFALALLTSSWLDTLVVSQVSKEEAPELAWVFDSGLYDSIKDGSVKVNSEL
jgi:hypothetical protein